MCVCVCCPCVNEDCGRPLAQCCVPGCSLKKRLSGTLTRLDEMTGWSALEESTSHRGSPLIISTFVIRKKHGNQVCFPESSCAIPVPFVLHSLSPLGHPISQQYLLKLCCRPNSSSRFHEMQRNKRNNPCL